MASTHRRRLSRHRGLLARAFAHAVPSDRQSTFLAACLPTGERGRAAFEDWLSHAGPDPLASLEKADRELLPLLLASLEANGVEPPGSLLSVLRAAHLHEERRSAAVARECRHVLETLNAQEIVPIVVGAAAYSENIYQDWSLRHCGRLELLVDSRELAAAGSLLRAFTGTKNVFAVLASGFPVALRTQLLPRARRPEPFEETVQRTVRGHLAGVESRFLTTPDLLVELCAVTGPHRAFSSWWPVDAALLLLDEPSVPWDQVADTADRNGALFAVWLRASWLADRFGLDVPEDFLRDLQQAARGEGRRELLSGASRVIARRLR